MQSYVIELQWKTAQTVLVHPMGCACPRVRSGQDTQPRPCISPSWRLVLLLLLRRVDTSMARGFTLGHLPAFIETARREIVLRRANAKEVRMEIFFAYSQVLKREREKLRQKVQGAVPPNPLCDTRPKTSPPLDLQKFLHLASACQSADH